VFLLGDQVGRDKIMYFYDRGTPIRLTAVTRRVLKPVEEAFVPPPGWAAVAERAANRRITLLQGPPGTGRETLGYRLLLDAGVTGIYAMPSSADALDRLADGLHRYPDIRATIKGAGLILRDLPDSTELHTRLRDLDAALERADAHLVLRLDKGVVATDEDLYDYLEPVEEGASHAKIVRSHLRMLVHDREADRLWEDAEVRALVESFAGPTTSRKRAADLANFIKQHTVAGVTDIGRVRDELRDREESDFDIWFRGMSLGDRCFAIALAVLSGLAYENIAAAAKALRTKVGAGDMTWASISAGGADPTHRERADLLRDLRARECRVYERDVFGQRTGSGLEYEDETDPKLIIERFWQRGEAQEAMLEWLRGLAESGPVRIRARAATVLGLLALHSFQYLCDQVFTPWADDEKWHRREAVALALSVPAADATLSPNVEQLVEIWHTRTQRPLAQATAARSYGASLVGSDLDWALDQLGRMSVLPHLEVNYAIGDSMSDLMCRYDIEPAETILRALRCWCGNPHRERTALGAFLTLANGLVVQVEDSSIERPLLIVLADGDTRVRAEVTTLWACALESQHWPIRTQRVLTNWAGVAEKDPLLRRVFADLIRAIAVAGPRLNRLVRWIVDEWGDADHLVPLPRTVAVIRCRMGWTDRTAGGFHQDSSVLGGVQ
jgi:hypothetical protein